uniref:Uncharacterized protein n=1 Tax=Urocitellus parryii TaxID=9999 RepID=A0A8D2H3N4_UROPR
DTVMSTVDKIPLPRRWPAGRGRQTPQLQWAQGHPTEDTVLGSNHNLQRHRHIIYWYRKHHG